MGRDRNPFSLGIPDERWEERIPALVVPIPNTEFHFICVKTQEGSYNLYGMQKQEYVTDLLMAASILTEWVKHEQEKEEALQHVVAT